MRDITEICRQRRYFFSLPVRILFDNLINRQVPVLDIAENDLITKLYRYYDHISDKNIHREFAKLITYKTILQVKEPIKIFIDPPSQYVSVPIHLNKIARSSRYSIWQFRRGEIIARWVERRDFGGTVAYFQYEHCEHPGDFLLRLANDNVAISEHRPLNRLADHINYESWLLDQCFAFE